MLQNFKPYVDLLSKLEVFPKQTFRDRNLQNNYVTTPH